MEKLLKVHNFPLNNVFPPPTVEELIRSRKDLAEFTKHASDVRNEAHYELGIITSSCENSLESFTQKNCEKVFLTVSNRLPTEKEIW